MDLIDPYKIAASNKESKSSVLSFTQKDLNPSILLDCVVGSFGEPLIPAQYDPKSRACVPVIKRI